MENVKKAQLLKEEIDALHPLNKEQEARIMQKFRLDWNYHSNHLEGNSLTFGETKALILHGITAQGKPLKDHFEITGHDEAIKWVDDVLKEKTPLTEHFIRQLHELLLKESSEKKAITTGGAPTTRIISVGKYKTTPNHVKTKTGEIFYFATPEETPAKMNDLMDWYNQQKQNADANPILLAAEFHYKFIRIHPFDDGNGRTARILMNFILMQYHFPPVIIKTEDKENYFLVLQQADAGILEPFIDYIAKNLVRSLEIMLIGAKGGNIEEENDIDKEIFLLEQKLKEFGKTAEILKNPTIVKNVFQYSITSFINPLIVNFEKLKHLYKETEFIIRVNGAHSKFATIEEMKNNAYKTIQTSDDVRQIELEYVFKCFKNIGIREFDYSNRIRFDFNQTHYTIVSENNRYFITKSYDEAVTNDEIKSIIDREMKHHTSFIEKKIKKS